LRGYPFEGSPKASRRIAALSAATVDAASALAAFALRAAIDVDLAAASSRRCSTTTASRRAATLPATSGGKGIFLRSAMKTASAVARAPQYAFCAFSVLVLPYFL